VQQNERVTVARSGEIADVDRAEAGQLEVASGRERRTRDLRDGDVGFGVDRLGVDRVAQVDSTLSTRTVSGPVGAW
jgi:hypothetical protein